MSGRYGDETSTNSAQPKVHILVLFAHKTFAQLLIPPVSISSVFSVVTHRVWSLRVIGSF